MKQLPLAEVHVDELLHRTVRASCKELHLRIGQSPYTRFCDGGSPDGLPEYEATSALDLQQMVYAILTDDQILQLEHEGEIRFLYSVARIAKFDVHVFRSRGQMEADFHILPSRD